MICWGEATFGELGFHRFCQDDAFGTTEKHPRVTAQQAKITAISFGRRMVAIVTENGEGKFCLQDEISPTEIRRKPEHLALKEEKIDSLSCGAEFIVMVSDKGNVFQLNYRVKPYIPRCLGALNGKHVIQVACGDHHTIALLRDGQLFTWGGNSHGQLGQGRNGPSSQPPKPLCSLSGIPLAMIAAGGDHSFALSLSGTVIAWGKNSTGQLGLGDTEDRYEPTFVKSLNLKRTVFISCGDEHTGILTKGGLMFTFGSGKYGQLGHNSNRDELRPRLVAELWGSRVTQIACGRHHTLAYIASLKTVYSFGCGEQGQLGNGQASNQNVPLPVQLTSEFDHGIGTILAGGNQSFCSLDMLPRPGKMIVTVDDNLINKWISECDSKAQRAQKSLKKEIMQTFSSALALNGSFLNQSGDKHYHTTMENSGLDFSQARLAFEKLAKNEILLKEVGSVVHRMLIPSLRDDPSGAEDLRVYLILPELLRVMPMDRDLCVKFAAAVCKLQPHCLKILEGLWAKLPKFFFKSLVRVIHSASTWFLYQMRTERHDCRIPVEKTAEVLQKLYQVNCNAGRKLEDRNFYIKEIKLCFESCEREPLKANTPEIIQFLVQRLTLYPAIFDMEMKRLMFKLSSFSVHFLNSLSPLQNQLYVSRKSLLTDTFQELRHNAREYLCPLEVKFKYENGIDQGGLSQEFFTIIAREIHSLQPRMLELFEDSSRVWFKPEGYCDHDAYYWLGILCGMALYRHCFVNFHFPLALFKKLTGFRPTLGDLEELSPTEARSLHEVLNEDEEVLEVLYLDFTAKGHEIIPNGREISVTKGNRRQFVEAYVDFIFNKSVEKQFKDFLEGFSQGCPNKLWKMFLPEELMALLIGNVCYVWEDLKKSALYQAYEPTDANIQNFWAVFFELSEEEKKNFLSFMTGSELVPIGGLAELKITIVNQNKPNPDDFHPTANTCSRRLYLPNYSSIDILREKFVHAISFYEEFGDF